MLGHINSVEIVVLGVLVTMLILVVFLAIGRFSNFNLIASELERYSNRTELEIKMYKKMTLLAVISSGAFYVGLFGTIVGVSAALNELGSADKTIMFAKVGVALLSTGASILVALFGNTLHSFLESKIYEILLLWDVQHGYDTKK